MDNWRKDIDRLILSTILIISTILIGTKISIAASGTFYVQPILPKNQLQDASDYYHIKVSGNTKQSLEFMIINDSDTEKVFDVNIFDGMTTSTGEISYGKEHIYDDSQNIKLSDVIIGAGEKKVPSKSSLKVNVNLDLNPKEFSGQLLGAINVSEKQVENVDQGGINNQFAYNIPIKIDVANTSLPAQMDYSGINIKEELNAYNLEIGLRNISAIIIRDLSISYNISSKKGGKTILKDSKSNLEMAPNSIFFPVISLKDKDIEAGEYNIKIHAESKESNIDKTWEDTFTISRSEAKNLNNGLSVSNGSPKLWIIIVALVILILMGTFILYRKYLKIISVNYKRLKQQRK